MPYETYDFEGDSRVITQKGVRGSLGAAEEQIQLQEDEVDANSASNIS